MHEFRIATSRRFYGCQLLAIAIGVGGFVAYVGLVPLKERPPGVVPVAMVWLLSWLAAGAFAASPRHRFSFDGSALRIASGSDVAGKLVPYAQLASYSTLADRRADVLELHLTTGEHFSWVRSRLLPGRESFLAFVAELDRVLTSGAPATLVGGPAAAEGTPRRLPFFASAYVRTMAAVLVSVTVGAWILIWAGWPAQTRHVDRAIGLTLACVFLGVRIVAAQREQRRGMAKK